jgi:hypothetical protein
MSVETPQKIEQKPTIQSLTKNLYSEWEVNANLQNSINLLLRKGYLSKDLNSLPANDISDDELAVLGEIKERAGVEGLEFVSNAKAETKKELTQDEILEVRQPFQEIIFSGTKSYRTIEEYQPLKNLMAKVKSQMGIIDPDNIPDINFQTLLNAFRDVYANTSEEWKPFMNNVVVALLENKQTLSNLNSEQIADFINSFGL